MSEHPILFNDEMVRAILDGRKTQTRRLIKAPFVIDERQDTGELWPLVPSYCNGGDNEGEPIRCPYGEPGDTLWVREAWSTFEAEVWHRADFVRRGAARRGRWVKEEAALEYECDSWSPSIHMPRWASRLSLRVTSVRAQQLQDITVEDIIAEGVDIDWARVARMEAAPTPATRRSVIRADFAVLWDSIYADRAPWASNPWVWAVGFEVIQ